MKGRSIAADLFVPGLVVGVVGMMVFPLPSALLDLLLNVNISLSLLLLLSALYLSDPEKFTVLPSLLLVTTLFRLALNISTTRQILIYGDAPSTVTAFGNFVIGGEYLVGIVLFLIISIVQFIVIAKGAERVAEVAARFTLDAMPGRQMAIDADVRAGVLTLFEARDQRLQLQRESKLYGALDGAMKFVKGDAVAGLLIIAVNAMAGVAIGICSHGLSFEQALKKYALFTVGDGLVSQVPALLVAVSAGVTLTRVSQGAGGSFGRDLFNQLGHDFRPALVGGVFLMLAAFAPGMPALPLIACAAALLLLSLLRRKEQNLEQAEAAQPQFAPKLYGPLVIAVSAAAVEALRADRSLVDRFQNLRELIFEKSGVVVPEPRFDPDSRLRGLSAVLYLQGVESGSLLSTALTAADRAEIASMLADNLSMLIERHRLELLDDSHTRTLLALHREGNEELINSLLPTVTSIPALTAVCRCLAAERVSIRSFGVILQAIGDFNLALQDGSAGAINWRSQAEGEGLGRSKLASMVAFVRIALKREITRLLLEDGEAAVWRLAAPVDDLLAAVAKAGAPLDPQIGRSIINAVAATAGAAGPPAVLTSNQSRSLLSELLSAARLKVLVVAAEEIECGVPLRIAGVIDPLPDLAALEPGAEDAELPLPDQEIMA